MYSKEQAEELVTNNVGSLEKLCKEAICTADLNLMLAMDFPEQASRRICEIIKAEANKLNIKDLREHYERSVSEGKSNIINTIVRRKHKVYFATRANLHPAVALEYFEAEANDICSVLFVRSMKRANEMKDKRREALIGKEIKRLAKPSFWLESGEGDPEPDYTDYRGDHGGRGFQPFATSVI